MNHAFRAYKLVAAEKQRLTTRMTTKQQDSFILLTA